MTPTEEDVRRAADILQSQHPTRLNCETPEWWEWMQGQMAQALADERERCAKIAEAHGHVPPFEDTELGRIASYSTATCERIADAIRSQR